MMRSVIERVISAGLILTVVFSGLAHGAVEPWSMALLELVIIALIFFSVGLRVKIGTVSIKFPHVTWPLFALLGLGVLQSIAIGTPGGKQVSLSFDVEATRSTTLALFALVAIAIIAMNHLNSRKRLQQYAHFLVIYGFAFAVFAFIQRYTWNGLFYWLRPSSLPPWQLNGTAVRGAFVNHNHFAGYMEMLFPLPIGLIITGAIGELRWLYGFAAIIMGIAIVAALSRGGLLSLVTELIFLLAVSTRLFLKRRQHMQKEDPAKEDGDNNTSVQPSTHWHLGSILRFDFPAIRASIISIGVIGFIALTTIGGVLWLDAESVSKRIFGTNPTMETFFGVRGWMWTDALAMFRAHPISGVGLGAFATAHPVYSRDNGLWVLEQAHNDYLQVLSDTGIIGGVIVLWFLVAIWREILCSVAARTPLLKGLAIGSGAGITGLLAHSFFDFNLQLPANALLFLMLTSITTCISAEVRQEKYLSRSHKPFALEV